MVSLLAARPHCHGVGVKTGKPCGNRNGLNTDGYCKFHVPDAPQCRGIAKSTGVRCRIRWDLNGDQFCVHHTIQLLNSKSPKEEDGKAAEDAGTQDGNETTTAMQEDVQRQCRGIAKTTGQRCRIKWKLNNHGFCEHHTSQTTVASTMAKADAACGSSVEPLIRVPANQAVKMNQCRGITKAGEPCRIKWKLNSDQLCKFHTDQTTMASAATNVARRSVASDGNGEAFIRMPANQAVQTRQCHGTAKTTGQRCRIRWDLDGHGLCQHHVDQRQHVSRL